MLEGVVVELLLTNGGTGYDIARIAVAATIGGTISKVTGGKFSNGATTAAFAQAFNGNLNRKGSRSNPMGMKTNGSISVEMGDGNYHWVDEETYIKNTINEQMASNSGINLADYVITTEKDYAKALGYVGGTLTAMGTGGGSLMLTGTGWTMLGGAYSLDQSPQNLISVATGPLSAGTSFIYRPLAQTISNIGHLNDAVTVACDIPLRCN